MFKYLSFLSFIVITSFSVNADDSYLYNEPSHSALGGAGLIQTPTARFSTDGDFAFGFSTESPYHRVYAKMQYFPWFEAVVKYTRGDHRSYYGARNPSLQSWKDKGLDVKFKLVDETAQFPQIALGIIDLGGTGAYSSEYFVASKKISNFDISLGLGWGRLAGTAHLNNPASWISKSRKVRGGYDPSGGGLNINRFFSGEKTSLFGGIEYFTPLENLSLKIEYDSSDYSDIEGYEQVLGGELDIYELDSRLNASLAYRLPVGLRDKIDFELGFIRGNTAYANFTMHSSLNTRAKEKFIAPPEIINIPYLEPYQSLNEEWQKYLGDLIIWQMGNVGFVTHKLVFNDNEMQAYISQGRFQEPIKAIDLASRILANNSPKNIDQLTIINVDQGIETLRASVSRKELVNSVTTGPLDESLVKYNYVKPIKDNFITHENDYLYPNFFWEIKPHMLGTLQHQAKFYFWQLEALIHTEYSIKQGLYLTADIGINIDNNYEDYTFHIPDGQLHHVRQDRRLYLTEGETGIRRMALDYLFKINPNITGKVSAGYLEWMYGGIGGEILYMPDDKHWAIGIDTYWVKQREFDQGFSFRDYDTITGFLTYYRDIPFYDTRLKLSAGKFLGKDKGFQVDISRRFDSGARVGGIVSLSDCDSACTGEGSFNKWIYFELPMDLFYINSSTRAKSGYAWSPLTKDSGTKVEPGNLYNLMINATDEAEPLRLKSWSIKKIFSGFSTKPKNLI